ncbi:BglG family transcription antiterminator [Niallia endozanthoxylica]|uniref:Transcription antiterminator n=1 Tax=Niallia endozanthoxylica TaxID=2036016 RepID=A0A5J5I6D5_9BACI|nr:BglG family transcription antiterminator [Niallia endozanthoxylica]KAA9029999.1 transcription antiterminator [Niallia endozanthoxylica]
MSDFMMDERIVQIIELTRKKTYCTLDELAESIGVSTRTIRNDIKRFNSDLKGIAVLENERGKGFRLTIENQPVFEELLQKVHEEKTEQDSPIRRIAFIINRLLNSEENNTLDEWAYEMNLSRSTLVNELKRAAVVLETYHLSIQGKPNSGMFLKGNELDLRFFILDNVYDYLYNENPLDNDIEVEIRSIANRHDFETTTQKKLLQSVIVMLDRLLKNHPLEKMDDKHEKLLDTHDYQIAKEITAVIERKLPIHIPKPEILFITLPIAGRRTPTNNRTMADVQITDDVNRLLEQIIEQVGFKKEIISENESFFEDLKFHLTFMLNRITFDIRIKNPLLSDVKEKYPVAFKMAEIAGHVIEKEYGLKVSEDELGYIAFYFGVFITQSEVKTKRLQRVAVICGTGRGTARLLAIQLQRILNHNTQIDLFSEAEVTKERMNQFDIVFSTVKLVYEIDVPLIMINEIFDEKRVSQQIEKVTYLQKFKLKDEGNHHSIIRLLTNEDMFFLLDSTKSYPENVMGMTEEMTRKGYFDEGFKERLLERAEKGSMVFDQYIALPHTIQTASEQIRLAVGVFPKPVQAEGKEVKLVFLLGIPRETDDDAGLLVKIYDEIIKISADEQLIEQLADSNSCEEFSKYLDRASRS